MKKTLRAIVTILLFGALLFLLGNAAMAFAESFHPDNPWKYFLGALELIASVVLLNLFATMVSKFFDWINQD